MTYSWLQNRKKTKEARKKTIRIELQKKRIKIKEQKLSEYFNQHFIYEST